MHRCRYMYRLALSSLPLLAAIACHREASPPSVPPTAVIASNGPPPELRQAELARGEYIANIAGCTTCHAKDLGGGGEMPLAGGIARMPNITPDLQTGIGAWTDAQIMDAIRRGTRPDGAHLAPLMPYPYFNRMTDADTTALVSYLRTQPPVHKQVARSERLPMQAIEMPAPVGNVDRIEDPRAHGEYLAALMHCADCHTPQQGPFAHKAYAGGNVFQGPNGRVIASNITSDRDTGIGLFDEADLVRVVRQMKDPTGQDVRAPMAMYKDAWSQLSDSDAHALAVFVRSLPPVAHDITTEVPPAVTQRP